MRGELNGHPNYGCRRESEVLKPRDTTKRLEDLERIVKHIPMGITYMDLDLRVQSMNSYFLDKLGLTAEDVVGRHCYAISAETRGERPEDAKPCGHCLVPKAIETGENQIFVNEINPNLIIKTTTIPLKDENGEIVGTMELVIDITEQRQMEDDLIKAHDDLELKVDERTAELRETNARLETLVQSMPDLVIFKDALGRHLVVNKAVEEFMGMSNGELIGKGAEDILPPEVAVQCQRSDEAAMRSPEPVRSEEYVGEGEGRIVLDTIKSPIRDEDGNVKGLVMVSRDITERKEAEEELKALHQHNELILNVAGEGIYGLDLDGKTTFVNPSAAKMIGWEPEELIGKSQHDVLHHTKPDGTPYPREECPIYHAFKDDKAYHVDDEVFWRKDGSSFPVEYISKPIRDEHGDVSGAVVTFKDITERKKAEDSLKLYGEIFSRSSDGIGIIDPQGLYLEQNPAHVELLGYSDEELLGKTPAIHIGDEQFSKVVKGLNEKGFYQDEVKSRTKSGTTMDIDLSAFPVFDEKGEVSCYVGIKRDITERKKAEDALKTRERQLMESQEVAKLGSWNWDLVNNILEWSDETFRRFDVDPETFTTSVEYFGEKIHPDDRKITQKAIQDSLENDTLYHVEPRIINDSGREWVMEAYGVVERDEDGNPLRMGGTAQDVTERKQAENELKIYSKQLETSLKEKEVLLKEIHHRVKNNMQVISSLLNLQSTKVQTEEDLAIFKESRDRIASMALVHEELYKSPDFANINFRDYIKDLAPRLFKSYNADPVKVKLLMDLEDIFIEVDKAVPCGLIVNELITNSLKHAFPDGREGEIVISLRSSDGDGMELVVRDSGIGISDDVDINNPKTLGLELITSLVKQIKAEMELDTSDGTEFRIRTGG